jgi:hypothetical protein
LTSYVYLFPPSEWKLLRNNRSVAGKNQVERLRKSGKQKLY